ncbi:hypothetical protein ACFSQQ_19775 [Mesorhizobium kowhaii]|uniref:hypothetical protein n=1 Tax=Mesorhizobium kowhaii TaxID=1300272 RepID=UPI0035E9C50E
MARALALTYAAEEAFEPAMEWLGEARRRCMRDTDSYAGLQVEILASQVEVNLKLDRPETADAVAREWLALAARTHRDSHVARAAGFVTRRS